MVDLSGEAHSLTRQIEDVKPKEIRARLAAVPDISGIEAARDRAGQHISNEQRREDKHLLPALVPYGLLIVSVLLAYANIYHNAFLYDDLPVIVQNNFLRHWSNLPDLLTGLSTAGNGRQEGFYRPLLMLIWFFTYQVFDLSTPAFHSLNILLHAANACLVFQLGRRIGLRQWVSFAAALLWAVHPVNTEAVDYISSLDDPLYILFLLLGLLVLLPDFVPRKFWQASLLFVLALGSKESAVVFPALAAITLFVVLAWRTITERGHCGFWLASLSLDG